MSYSIKQLQESFEQFRNTTSNVFPIDGNIKINGVDLDKIINLNEELTAENARLLTELDEKADVIAHLNQWQESYQHYYQLEVNGKVKLIENINNLKCKVVDLENELFTVKEDLSSCSRICTKHTDELRRCCIELNSIKSKWWYKLMTWGW